MSDNSDEGYFKYFNKKDVTTRLKFKKGVETLELRAWEGNSNKKYVFERHDEITVLKKTDINELDRKYKVKSTKYRGVTFLVPKGLIEKPKLGTEAIKPQNFSLDGINLTAQNIQKLVKSNMHKIQELEEVIQEYLIYLTHAATKENPSSQYKHFKKIPQDEIKRIAKNFGEVISALAVLTISNKLFPNIKIDRDDRAFFPTSLTEGLYDFAVNKVNGSLKYKFSVKAQIADTSSNTVKPEDIMKLIEKDKAFRELCKNKMKHQYQITKILAENSVRHGPLLAVIYAKRNNLTPKEEYFKGKTDGTMGAKVLIKKSPEQLEAIIKRDKVKKQNDELYKSYAQIFLEVVSKKVLNFSDFFLGAIRTKVYYVIVAGLNERGIIWKTMGAKGGVAEKEIKAFDITLRGKHDFNSGRMGFDV